MTISIRRAYPVMIILTMALTLAGCATTSTTSRLKCRPCTRSRNLPTTRIFSLMTPGKASTGACTNSTTTSTNTSSCRWSTVTSTLHQSVVQTSVSNFFNNIGEVRTFYNSLLQAKGEKALVTFSRFLTNTTLGIGGLFDPATHFDLKRQNEDFGQTLGVWGVGGRTVPGRAGSWSRHCAQRQRVRRGYCHPRRH